MNRPLRRFVLKQLERSEDGSLMSHELITHLPEILSPMTKELKTTCELLDKKGEILLQVNPGTEEYHVELKPLGRTNLKDLNDDHSLSLDILSVLKHAKRGDFGATNGFYSDIVVGDVVTTISNALTGSKSGEVKACLQELEGLQVKLGKANGGFILDARILPSGMEALSRGSLSPGTSNSSVHFDQSVQINNSHGIVNYQSDLRDVVQKIQASDLSQKDLIAAKFSELEKALAELDEAHQEDVESVQDSAQILAKELMKNKPSSSRIQVSADGLKEAANVLRDISPAVFSIVTQIVAMVMTS